MQTITSLPADNKIDVSVLARIFKHTTTAYKLVFFQALLALLKEHKFQKTLFSFAELEQAMLKISDYPLNVCQLNFGAQDKIADKLNGKSHNLMAFVPYRLLSPFFTPQIQGLSSNKTHQTIEKLSNMGEKYRPIYKINNKKIELYPEWTHYFESHFSVIEGWTFWHWVTYLQGKNPNAIGLVHKLQKPSMRSALTRQTAYWNTVLEHQKITCFLSQQPITTDNLSLDHFLPWHFIGHDQLWNLSPVIPSANASKSDNIPSMEAYLNKFINLQLLGLKTSHSVMNRDLWENYAQDFVTGLNVDTSDLIHNPKTIADKYRETLMPLANIAHNSGFSANWIYKNH